ncbi:MAG: hypothetical protein U5L10_02795 [Candidatus Moranbacteria bacterium]|nr:hypothetical protein [Candidatus Moranbacteria bacterium]
MRNSNFHFIGNAVLRNNLDETFNHIVVLLAFVESTTYGEEAKSAFRKTIIIHTASIVEALLFYLMDKRFNNSAVSKYYTKWALRNYKEIYKINEKHLVVAGEYTKEASKLKKEKMNLGQIANFLRDKKVIDDSLYEIIDEIRLLRNEQHIGTQKTIKRYSKKELDRAFYIAGKTKEFVNSAIV